MWDGKSETRRYRINYIAEVVTKDARCEHRFEDFENAKRYANDVQRLNPDVEINLYFDAEGWRSEYRRDVWQEEARWH